MIFANEIHIACNRTGTDEQSILNVISQCSMEDLQLVSRAYYVSFGKPIYHLLKNEISGKFREIILGSFEGRYQYWIRQIREAIKAADQKAFIELVIMGNTYDWFQIKQQYFKTYDRNVVDDILKVLNNIAKNADWVKLLSGWIFQMRYPRCQPENDADELYKAAKGAGTDVNTFIRLFCSTTNEEFVQIARIYQEKYKIPLRQTIIIEFSGKSEKVFLLAHDYLISPTKGCCWIINNSINCSRDKSLVDITVLFRDQYSSEILQVYKESFGNLTKEIKQHCTGWFEKALLSLWKAQ
ncbi:Annexin_1 [Hexamita inflata]|uniref:Annexin 1 n=1 Tax=Hexamita inflata TaxID=28002 RepID=A0AA86UWE0_9EUKA|nr:Annexin 1 [Hexamita inflata]